MTEQSARDDAEASQRVPQIQNFIGQCKAVTSLPAAKRRTIIFFPGGLGSALRRAEEPYQSGPSNFDDFWLDLGLLVPFFGGVDALAMTGDEDSEDRIVVPDKEITVCPIANLFGGVGPYDRFRKWAKDNGLDLFIFGYDWRRRPEYVLKFFTDKIFPLLTQGPNAVTDLTLIGHSEGGMLVKLLMNDPNVAPHVTRAITVASPFYGVADETLRYFEGQPDFFPLQKDLLAKVSASMEGGYFMQFLDEQTFNTFGARLKNNAATYPLNGYPSTDPNSGVNVDPYNPSKTETAPNKMRYPPWVDRTVLTGSGLTKYRELAQELPVAVAAKFYCLRGVQNDGTNDLSETPVAQTWSTIDGTFDPQTSPCPITHIKGAGDGSVPAWTARPIWLEEKFPANITTLRGHLDHSFLMEHEETQERIRQILYGVPSPTGTVVSVAGLGAQFLPEIDAKSIQIASEFVVGLANACASQGRFQRNLQQAATGYVQRHIQTRADGERMARLILALILGGPARMKLLQAGDGERARANPSGSER